MKNTIYPSATRPSLSFRSLAVIVSLFLFALLHAGSASSSVPANLTFRWQANPPQDNVTGYRLYFSSESRFDANGKAKAGFAYDYYIDFADSLLCDNSNSVVGCQYLDPGELSCADLNGSTPKCTISAVQGTNYFALTARSGSLESNYTQEIKAVPKTVAAAPGARNIIPILEQLLLN